MGEGPSLRGCETWPVSAAAASWGFTEGLPVRVASCVMKRDSFAAGEDLRDEGQWRGWRPLRFRLLETGLVGFVQVGAGVEEAVVVDLDEADGLGGRD